MKITTAVICAVASLLVVTPSRGQVMLSPAFTQGDQAATETETSTTVRLHPRRQSDPMLEYRLWPAPEKRRPRPVMVAVNRALILVAQVSPTKKREFLERYDTWTSLPIDQLPIDEARESYGPFETAIGVLRTGETWMGLDYDLGMAEMSAEDRVSTLLPEFQEMRDLARLIALRTRVAAAQGRWGDAVADLRLGFRLSQAASHSTDTLLGRLIGTAISETMFKTIESMIQQPECPNLYWALAGLPADQLFDFREAMEYESTLSSHLGIIAGLDELPDSVIGEQEALLRLKKITHAFATMFHPSGGATENTSLRQMTTGFQIALMVGPARQLLSNDPDWSDRVDELSDAEAVLRASDFELARIRDAWLAWALLPPELWDEAEARRRSAMTAAVQPRTLGGQLARMMTPSVSAAMSVPLDVRQQLHRLLTLEALRMHAAENAALPETLTDLTPVPAWHDPRIRRSFQYARHSETEATLSMAEGPRSRDDITLNIKLEVN
ncbi:hypothetical protein [Stieleria mannarensis]|uniref:hypothetical protein n=1 Tax=Stieleria mannarensis TaxID=2755585 RepID=UPI0015FF810E|nr:hypothetical protein [Rhodopirellula sp. JC639]